MSDTPLFTHKELTSGDAAIDGLFGGLLAGIVMAVFLAAAGLSVGDVPGEVLARFAPGGAQSPLGGLIAHLAVSGIYGALFGLVCQMAARRWIRSAAAWIAGLAGGLYGLALLILAQAAFLPGAGAALKAFPPLHFALAHLIFGIVLGVITNRSAKRGMR
jgi:hypothetical protein